MNNLVTQALHLAAHAHRGQYRRTGEEYVNHPYRVARRASDLGFSVHVVAAALLHDVVEDTDYTLTDLRQMGFPEDVVRAVDSVTRRPGEAYFDLVRRAAADPIGRIVKQLDNDDNSGDEGSSPSGYRDRVRSIRKYVKARTILRAAMYGIASATPLNSVA